MVEESSPLPPAEESIEGETETALEPEPESGEPTSEPISEPGFVCECEEWMRSACKGLPFYKELESQCYCVLHYPAKEKSADFKAAFDSKLNIKDFDFRGVWFTDEVDFHRFDFNSDAYFKQAIFGRDADFSYATFRAVADFSLATFGADADFSFATFTADADFRFARFMAEACFRATRFISNAVFYASFDAGADFSRAKFSAEGEFRSTTFSADADFSSTTFRAGAYFSHAKFSAAADFTFATFSADADFTSATLSDADFNLSVFHARADFSRATFRDSIHFFGSATEGIVLLRYPTERLLEDGTTLPAMSLGKDSSLDFQHVRIEHPERIAFHTLNLRPHWFVNVDSRRFVFTDVSWEWDRISINEEIAALETKLVSSSNRLLAIACRQLAENAEANNRYEEASRFRYWAMNLARQQKWESGRFWKTDWLHMLYWAVSGYGERILRALGVLAAVWFVFVLLYTQVGFEQRPPSNQAVASVTAASNTIEDRTGQPLDLSRALTYSLAVMSLQKPEPKPLTGTAQTLVLLEAILGPVQAALLALAIRRKFMR